MRIGEMKKSTIGYVVIVVVLVAAALFYITSQSSAGTLNQYIGVPVNQTFMLQLQSIANNQTLASKVGIGVVSGPPTRINANTLLLNGSPEVLYIGADYCPYCAAARWGLVLALLRFGNMSNLAFMTSNGSDVDPNTPTFTFSNVTYNSKYISFVGREIETRSYQPFQNLTPSESNIFSKFDSAEDIPFIDFANYSIQLGAPFEPKTTLDGHTWAQIATYLSNPSTPQSKAVIGTANIYTAYICEVSKNVPPICSQPFVKSLQQIYG